MIRMIRIRKRRLLKKFFLFFTFSTPFSSVMQFDACFLSVRKTVIVYRILIILSQKNGLFYILAKSNLFFAAINAQDISQEILPQSLFYYIRSLLLLRTDMTYSSYTATVLTKFTFHGFSPLFFFFCVQKNGRWGNANRSLHNQLYSSLTLFLSNNHNITFVPVYRYLFAI